MEARLTPNPIYEYSEPLALIQWTPTLALSQACLLNTLLRTLTNHCKHNLGFSPQYKMKMETQNEY